MGLQEQRDASCVLCITYKCLQSVKSAVKVRSLQDDWRHGLFDERLTHMLVGGAKRAVRVKMLQDDWRLGLFDEGITHMLVGGPRAQSD